MFTQQSSPDSNNDNNSFGMSNFYGQNVGNLMGGGGPMSFDMNKNSGPMLSTTSTESGDGGQGAGEVFMGVQSPQPGGIPVWKWSAMGGDMSAQEQK